MSSLWRRTETLILPRRFLRSLQTLFGSVCVGRGILSRKNWRPSGFQKVSKVSFFRLRQAPVETLQCISQTPVLEASSFAIVPKSWRPFADHVLGSVACSGALLTYRGPRQAFLTAAFGTDLLCKNQKVGSRENNPPSCPPTGVFLVLKLNFLA